MIRGSCSLCCALAMMLVFVACESEDGEPNPQQSAGAGGTTPNGEAGSGGAEAGAAPYDCVRRPTTHLEIINACTDAIRIEKQPELPPLQP